MANDMRKTVYLQILLLVLLGKAGSAQLNHVWDNALELEWLDNDRWTAVFAFDNRAFVEEIFDPEKGDFEDTRLDFSFIEVTQEIGYHFNERYTAGLEVRFRYESLFNRSEDNEIRLTPFFEYETERNGTTLTSDIRLEQRNYPEATAYRLKIAQAWSRPFNVDSNKENPLAWFTEQLLALQYESSVYPEYELRNEVGIVWTVLPKLEFEPALQLRSEYDFEVWDFALFYRTKLKYSF